MKYTHQSPRIVDGLGILVLMGVLSGCSVMLAATKPEPKDMDVLVIGTPRGDVLKEFGQPAQTGLGDGNRVDTFTYKEGERSNKKLGRAALHGSMDLISFGVWELFATPTEIMAIQPDITVEVTYDERDRVASAGPPGFHWVKAGSTKEDFQRDNYDCRQASRVSAPIALAGVAQASPTPLDQPSEKQAETIYQDCMWARGFKLNRRLPGH